MKADTAALVTILICMLLAVRVVSSYSIDPPAPTETASASLFVEPAVE